MRLRKIKNAEEILINNAVVINKPRDYYGKWHTYFNNNHPIHLEIGMGKGKFIIEHAIKYPNFNFIGFEKESTVICKALNKIPKNLPNLAFICEDAEGLPNIFSENEINHLYLNFSDPWPKNRHQKRRLTSDTKLEIYKKILHKDNKVTLKTDNRHFFEYSLLQFIKHGFTFLDLSLDLHADKEQIITTEYEDKFIKLGQNIYYFEVCYGKNETL